MFFPAFKCNDIESFQKICTSLQQIGTPNHEHIEIRKVEGYYQPSLIAKPRFIRWIISRIFGKPEHQKLHTVTDFVVKFFEINKLYVKDSKDAIRTLEAIRDRMSNLEIHHKFDTLVSRFAHPDLFVLPSGTHKLITRRHDQQNTDFSFKCQGDRRAFAHLYVLKQCEFFKGMLSWQSRTVMEYDNKEKNVKATKAQAALKVDSMDLSIFPKSTVDILLDILYDNPREITMPRTDFTELIKLADYLLLDQLRTILKVHEKKLLPKDWNPTITFPETFSLRTHNSVEPVSKSAFEQDVKANLEIIDETQSLSELMLQGRIEISLENLLSLYRLAESRGLTQITEHIENHLASKILENPELLVDALLIFYKKMKPQRDRNNFDKLEEFLIWKPAIFGKNICSIQKQEQLFKLFLSGAEKGDPIMQNYTGFLFLKGFGTEMNFNKSVKWFQASVNQGNSVAKAYLGYCYEHGLGVTKNLTEALKLYHEAALNGVPYAYHALGHFYQDGIRVTKDIKKAISYFRAGTRKGCALSMVSLGKCYQTGSGVQVNHNKAIALFKKAASWHWCGHLGLAKYYEEGSKSNHIKCFQTALEAASFYNYAQTYVGYCFISGIGVARDPVEGMRWYRKAAENGSVPAQNYLGECYYYGNNHYAKDYAEAFKWFSKAAEQNHPLAQSSIAAMYYNGYHVGRDYHQALMWVIKAEESAHHYSGLSAQSIATLTTNYNLITNHPL